MKYAVIYARVSTEEQAKKGFSIETQVDRCSDFAESNNYIVSLGYVFNINKCIIFINHRTGTLAPKFNNWNTTSDYLVVLCLLFIQNAHK